MEFHPKRKTFRFILEEEVEEEPILDFEQPRRSSLSRPSFSSPWTLSPLHNNHRPSMSKNTPSLLYHCMATLHRQDGNVLSITVSKRLVFTASESDRVRIWKQPECMEKGHIRTHHRRISTMLAFSNTLFTAHNDHRIRAWSVITTKKLATLPLNTRSLFSWKSSDCLRHQDTITCMALYHAEALLYSGSADRTVKAWRLNDPTNCCVDSFVAHDRGVNAMVVNQKDGCLITGSSDWTVKFWHRVYGHDSCTHALRLVLRFQPSPVNALALGASSCHLYSGTSDGHISIWEKEDEAVASNVRYRHGGFLHGHRSPVLCLVTVGRAMVVSGSEDSTIRVWRREEHCGISSYVCMAVMEGHKGPVTCLAASMEVEEEEVVEEEGLGLGFLLYSASFDRMVKVWRVKVVGKEQGGGSEEGRRSMSPVLSPLWVEKRIQGMHLCSTGGGSQN